MPPNEEPPRSWDWRDHEGVLGPILNQKLQAICWAIALVRAIQVLLNIGLTQRNQTVELSIQHAVNQVKYDEDDGVQNLKRAFKFAKEEGICNASQCSPNTADVVKKLKCKHPHNINTHKVDEIVHITQVKDDELLAIVSKQPIIGILRNTGFNFDNIRSNSHGETWGVNGFGYVHRRINRGEGSEFYAVAYPNRRGYPRNQGG